MNNKTTAVKVNLGKYFVRTPEEDFSDDGNRFTAYSYGHYIITKCMDEVNYYISARRKDGEESLTYNERAKLPHFLALNRLNSISKTDFRGDKDLERLRDDIDAYEHEHNEAVKSVKQVSDEELNEYYDKKAKFIHEKTDATVKRIDDNAKIILRELSKRNDSMTDIRNFYNDVDYQLKRNMNIDQTSRRYMLQTYETNGFYYGDFYLKQVNELLDKLGIAK